MSARSINIYNMLPGDDLINEINKSFSGPAREQKLEIARQLELYNTMFDDNLTFGEYERACVCPKKTNEYVEELE